MNLNDVRLTIGVFKKLRELERKLHKLDETACNGYYSESHEKRCVTLTNKYEKQANEEAKMLGLEAFHQSDPRGCALVLGEIGIDNTNYDNGIRIY